MVVWRCARWPMIHWAGISGRGELIRRTSCDGPIWWKERRWGANRKEGKQRKRQERKVKMRCLPHCKAEGIDIIFYLLILVVRLLNPWGGQMWPLPYQRIALQQSSRPERRPDANQIRTVKRDQSRWRRFTISWNDSAQAIATVRFMGTSPRRFSLEIYYPSLRDVSWTWGTSPFFYREAIWAL